jgi:hypothetical protein
MGPECEMMSLKNETVLTYVTADRAWPEPEVFSMYRNCSRYLLAIVSSLTIVLATHPILAATPTPAAPGVPLASNFPGPFWEVVTPAGGTASVSSAHLFLNVPGGSNHDALLPSNQAVRVVQPIGNDNFDVSIKIDSPLAASNEGTKEGLMVVSDSKDFISFELATDGINIHLSAETVARGVATAVLDDANFNQYQTPMYLRLKRAANIYSAYYSIDGATWTLAIAFTDTKIPTLIGPFASNFNATPSKAVPVAMSVNWFDVQ